MGVCDPKLRLGSTNSRMDVAVICGDSYKFESIYRDDFPRYFCSSTKKHRTFLFSQHTPKVLSDRGETRPTRVVLCNSLSPAIRATRSTLSHSENRNVRSRFSKFYTSDSDRHPSESHRFDRSRDDAIISMRVRFTIRLPQLICFQRLIFAMAVHVGYESHIWYSERSISSNSCLVDTSCISKCTDSIENSYTERRVEIFFLRLELFPAPRLYIFLLRRILQQRLL